MTINNIRLSKSVIGTAEKNAVQKVLENEYLGMGEETKIFERQLSDFFGRSAVCVSNGTAALHLSIQACGIGPGDEVIAPSLTYISSYQAISATGASITPCDVLADTLTIDPTDAERRVNDKTKAIMPVHYAGGVGRLTDVYKLAQRYGLRVIEDAAHAFGTTYSGQPIGAFGDISCFSFDGIKNITSGEGGCVVSEDNRLIEDIRTLRLLGVEQDTEARYRGARTWDLQVTRQGWRYHMSNIMASIGIEQFKRLPEFATARQQLAKHYDLMLNDYPNIRPLDLDYSTVVPHIYVVRIKGLKNRESLRENLKSKGIETGVHYKPNHMLQFYKNISNHPLPVTESVYPEILSLPLHPELTETDIEYVITELNQLL
jgi:dTDP-4-amino-4,6-dideoxygalactose transaminase